MATAIGAAGISVLLASRLTANLPARVSDLATLYATTPAERAAIAEPLTTAFQITYALPISLMLLALVIAIAFLPRPRRVRTEAPSHRCDYAPVGQSNNVQRSGCWPNSTKH